MVLKVNFSDKEASSEAREYTPLPSGSYYCRITDITVAEVKETDGDGNPNKNAGKAYWNMEYTVQDGQFDGRKLFGNCMLFDGALYTLAQICKATGFEGVLQSGIVPDPDDLISKEVTVVIVKQRNKYKEKRNGDGEPVWDNDVKGIKAYAGATHSSAPSSGGSSTSVLP